MINETKKQEIFDDNIIVNDRVGIYCRVSTEEQAKAGFSLSEQEERLRALCTYKKYKIIDVYVDAGISAKNTDRPEFQRMMCDAKNGKINRIVSLKLDRVTRSILDLEKLVREIEEYNCSLECAYEEINTSNANGKFFIRLITILAQLELERTSERTMIGLDGALKAKHVPVCPLGFKKNKDKTLDIDEETAPIIRDIFQRYLDGVSVNKIATQLTEEDVLGRKWRESSVNKILQDRLYIGEYVQYKNNPDKEEKIFYEMAPNIISRETFEKAINQREKNGHNYFVKHSYMFKQKITCPKCHNLLTTYSGKTRNGSEPYLYYKCSKCKPKYFLSEKKLEKQFIDIINNLLDYYSLLDTTFITLNTRNYNAEITILEKEIEDIKRKIKNEKLLVLDKKLKPEEMREIVAELEQEQKKKIVELNDFKERNSKLINIDNNNYFSQNLIINDISLYVMKENLWYKLTREQKSKLIKKYVNKIEVDLIGGNEIKIKNVEIYDDKILQFGRNFRKDIFYLLNKQETITIPKYDEKILNTMTNYYKLSIENIKGTLVNVDGISNLITNNVNIIKCN